MITDAIKDIKSKENGLFFVRVRPEDCVKQFRTTWDDLEEYLLNSFQPKYRNKLIGLRHDKWHTYEPVFDEETQREWDKELHDYISRKAAWCQKHGSE